MGTATAVHGRPGLWSLRAGHRHGRSSAIAYAQATTHGLPRGPDRRARADGPSPLTLCPQDPTALLSTGGHRQYRASGQTLSGGPGALNPTLPLWSQHWTEACATRTLLINGAHACMRAGAHGWGPPPPEAGPGQQTTVCSL